MKKFILTTFLSVFTLIAMAAGEAEIKFEKNSHDFGTFPESTKVTCTFKFTNTGDKLLVIHQAIASCSRRAAVHNNPDPYFSRQQTLLDRNVMETVTEALRITLSSAPAGAGFLWLTSCSPYQISFLSLSTFNCSLTVPPSF